MNRIPRRHLLVTLILALGAVGCGKESPPNVIVLVIDTLRADHLSGYGYHRPTSPRLDELMESGVRFENAIATSSWSAPSHVSIITGTRDDHHRILNWGQTIARDVVPLAVPLKGRGYQTGLFSTHLALHNSIGRIDEAIDHKLVLDNRADAKVLPAAAEWALAQKEPFFLYAVVMGPHAPYDKYPDGDNERYFTDDPPEGDRTFPFATEEWIGDGAIPKSVQLEGRHDVGYYINRYDRAIRYTDQLIGGMLDRLRVAGKLDNTLIVVTSDHGEGFGEHGCFAHELHLYDFLIRVPLIVSYPGKIPANSEWNGQVSLTDIVPTVLSFTGAEMPPRLDGTDLSDWLRGTDRPKQSPILCASYRSRGFDRYMARSNRYKLILDKKSRHEELYDLEADPNELSNLLDGPKESVPDTAYVGLRAHLLTYLAGHRAASTDLPASFRDPEVMRELSTLGYLQLQDDPSDGR